MLQFVGRMGAVLLACVAAAAAPHSGAQDSGAWPLTIERDPSPAPPGSAQPQLSVSDRGVLLSWVESSGAAATLKFAERTRGGGWTRPVSVASGDNWFVNWADVPSVVRLGNRTLAAHWLQKSGTGTYAYDVRLSYSRDEGRTWSPPVTPHHDGTKTEHGFASLFEMPGAGLGLVWLDGRAMKPEAHGHGGAMSLRFAAFDRNWKQTAEAAVDLQVCECCPTAVAVTAEGPIAAFRNRTDAEVRDIYVTRFTGGQWSSPIPVHADDWKIAACPVNGPMVAARGRDAAVAWFTAAQDQGRAFAAFSSDAGRSFGAPVRLDDAGSLGRVDIELLADGSAAASWIEVSNGAAQFRVRRIEPSGRRSRAVTIAGVAGNRTSGYPRLAHHQGEIVFAWTESAGGDAALQVRTATARVTAARQH